MYYEMAISSAGTARFRDGPCKPERRRLVAWSASSSARVRRGAVTEVQVLTNLEFVASDYEDPFLRVLFVRAILDHISRGFEVLFVEDDPEQFPVWQKTIGARRFGDFIVAAAGYRLPDLGAPRERLALRQWPPLPSLDD
jgi:hypothetical protein